jgi:hypothetical protein
MRDNDIETRYLCVDGHRQLSYCEYGDPEGKLVLYFHGTPGSRYEAAFSGEADREHGYRVIALDRPRIGRSDYVRGRSLLDWPQDVRQAAAQLQVDKLAPFSYGVHLHDNLPRSDLHAYPEHGHLFVMKLFDDVFSQVSRSG